jgi:hypothetical protein
MHRLCVRTATPFVIFPFNRCFLVPHATRTLYHADVMSALRGAAPSGLVLIPLWGVPLCSSFATRHRDMRPFITVAHTRTTAGCLKPLLSFDCPRGRDARFVCGHSCCVHSGFLRLDAAVITFSLLARASRACPLIASTTYTATCTTATRTQVRRHFDFRMCMWVGTYALTRVVFMLQASPAFP